MLYLSTNLLYVTSDGIANCEENVLLSERTTPWPHCDISSDIGLFICFLNSLKIISQYDITCFCLVLIIYIIEDVYHLMSS